MKPSTSRTSMDPPPTSSPKRSSSLSKKKKATIPVFVRTNSGESAGETPDTKLDKSKKSKTGRRSKSKSNGIVLERRKSKSRKRSSKGLRKSIVRVAVEGDDELNREMSDDDGDDVEEKQDDQEQNDMTDNIRKTTSFEESIDDKNQDFDDASEKVTIAEGRCSRGFNPCCTCHGKILLRTWCKACGLFLAGFSVLGIIVCNSLYVNRINFLLHLEENDKDLKNAQELHILEKSGLNIILIIGIFTGLLQLISAQCYIPCLCIVQAVNSSVAVCLVIVIMVFEIADASHDWKLILGMFIYLLLIGMFIYFAICSIGFYCQLKAGLYAGHEHESSVEQAL